MIAFFVFSLFPVVIASFNDTYNSVFFTIIIMSFAFNLAIFLLGICAIGSGCFTLRMVSAEAAVVFAVLTCLMMILRIVGSILAFNYTVERGDISEESWIASPLDALLVSVGIAFFCNVNIVK